MNYLLFAGSLRKDSLNKKLLHIAHSIVKENSDAACELIDIKSLNLPVYDGDIETAGMPAGVSYLGKKITWAHGVIVASPEYNGSISSPLKNTLDWVSRLRPIPMEGKTVLQLGASPGQYGTMRGLLHARQTWMTLGNYVYPENFALARAHEAFTESGTFVDSGHEARLKKLLNGFFEFTTKMKG